VRGQHRHFPTRGASAFRGVQTGSEADRSAEGHEAGFAPGTGIPAQAAGSKIRRGSMIARRKGEHGSAILETLLSMMLLGMILFGILQLFQLVLADMIVDYAAYRGARSAAVGFNDRIAKREALIKSVPASGALVFPDPGVYDDYRYVETEKVLLRNYQKSIHNVSYANWSGKERYHLDYRCPDYGEPLSGGCGFCSHSSHVEPSPTRNTREVGFRFEFIKYPLTIPLHNWFTGTDSVNIRSDAEDDGYVRLTNYSAAFLDWSNDL
jgi:hypothetical protein